MVTAEVQTETEWVVVPQKTQADASVSTDEIKPPPVRKKISAEIAIDTSDLEKYFPKPTPAPTPPVRQEEIKLPPKIEQHAPQPADDSNEEVKIQKMQPLHILSTPRKTKETIMQTSPQPTTPRNNAKEIIIQTSPQPATPEKEKVPSPTSEYYEETTTNEDSTAEEPKDSPKEVHFEQSELSTAFQLTIPSVSPPSGSPQENFRAIEKLVSKRSKTALEFSPLPVLNAPRAYQALSPQSLHSYPHNGYSPVYRQPSPSTSPIQSYSQHKPKQPRGSAEPIITFYSMDDPLSSDEEKDDQFNNIPFDDESLEVLQRPSVLARAFSERKPSSNSNQDLLGLLRVFPKNKTFSNKRT
jgi:hypothetical protein